MKRNNILLMMVYGLAGFVVIFGVYSVIILEPEERAMQIEQAQKVANGWKNLAFSDTSCDEVEDKIFNLTIEKFEGKELIMNELIEKYREGECGEELTFLP